MALSSDAHNKVMGYLSIQPTDVKERLCLMDLIHIFWDDQGDDRVATINKRIPNKLIEWRWNDDPESYMRMEIVTSELSNSTSLMVDDHDKGLETESLEQIWIAHEERLFASLGIL